MLSERLLNVLPGSGTRVGELLERGEYDRTKIDYVDVAEEGDRVALTYLPANRLSSINATFDREYFTSGLRQSARPATVLKKLVGEHDEDDVRKFVEYLNGKFKMAKANVKEWSGEEILKGYHERSYHRDASEGTMLGKSCMRGDASQSLLKFYVDNPEAVSLMVVERDSKVAARALVWNARLKDEPNAPIRVLDRIYFAKPEDEIALIEWAKKNCDYYRTRDKKDYWFDRQGRSVKLELFAPVRPKWRYEKYPYVDTFCYLHKNYNRVANYIYPEHDGPYRTMQNQHGPYTDSEGDTLLEMPDGHVWVQRHNRTEPEENTVIVNGQRYLLDEVQVCWVCNTQVTQELFYKMRGIEAEDDMRVICRSHTPGRNANDRRYFSHEGRDFIHCVKCNQFRPGSGPTHCDRCKAGFKTCPDCNDRVPDSRQSLDDENVHYCETHFYSHHFNCEKCHTDLSNSARYRDKVNVCKKCGPKEFVECSKCNERFPQDQTWVSPNDAAKTYCTGCYTEGHRYCDQCGLNVDPDIWNAELEMCMNCAEG